MEKLVKSIINEIMMGFEDDYPQPITEETNSPTFIQLINAAERDGHIKGMETSAQYITSAAKKIAKNFDIPPPEEKKVLGKSYYDAFLKKIGIVKEDANSPSCSCGCGACGNQDGGDKTTTSPTLVSDKTTYYSK